MPTSAHLGKFLRGCGGLLPPPLMENVAIGDELRGQISAMPVSSRPVVTVEHMKTFTEMAEMSEAVLTMDSGKAVELKLDEIKACKLTIDSFVKSYIKAAKDTMSYLSTQERQKKKEEEKMRKNAEKKQADAAKAKAKTVVTSAQDQQKHNGAIFSLKESTWGVVAEVAVGAVMSLSVNMSGPWVIRKSPEAKAWREEASMLLHLSEYGGC